MNADENVISMQSVQAVIALISMQINVKNVENVLRLALTMQLHI